MPQALLQLRHGLTGAGSHKSIIAYLSANNLPATAAALRQELSLPEEVLDSTTVKKYEGLLEKKWTSVVRLQKKVGLKCSIVLLARVFE